MLARDAGEPGATPSPVDSCTAVGGRPGRIDLRPGLGIIQQAVQLGGGGSGVQHAVDQKLQLRARERVRLAVRIHLADHRLQQPLALVRADAVECPHVGGVDYLHW